MPTVDKTGKYDVEGENTGVKDGITIVSSESQDVDSRPAKAKQSLSERSAFSETDLKGRIADAEGENAAKDGFLSRYSDSNIQLAKLDVPFFDDSRSELSGGSGLAIVPSLDGRSLLSQDSGRELVPVVSTEDHDKDENGQEGKGNYLVIWYPIYCYCFSYLLQILAR